MSYQLDSVSVLQIAILCLVNTLSNAVVYDVICRIAQEGGLPCCLLSCPGSALFSAAVSEYIFIFWQANFSNNNENHDLPDNKLCNADALETPLTYMFHVWPYINPNNSIILYCISTLV